MEGTEIPTERNIKLLSVTLDHSITFGEHAKILSNTASNRNNALRAINSGKQGPKKKVDIIVYKVITRSVFNYAASVWAPNLAETHWRKLEARENDSLRTTTGCTRMTAIDNLRQERLCLPVKTHNKMQPSQFAADMKNPTTPATSYKQITKKEEQSENP